MKTKGEDIMDNLAKMFNCPEIQDGWEPKVGDWTDKGLVINYSRFDHKSKIWLVNKREIKENWSDKVIFIPGTRQLIEMLPKDGDYKLQWNDGFDFMYPAGQGYYHYLHAKCPKEALLGGVMHELHGKKWSGERWE